LDYQGILAGCQYLVAHLVGQFFTTKQCLQARSREYGDVCAQRVFLRRRFSALIMVGAMLLTVSSAAAQRPVVLAGVVTDSVGNALLGATVSVAGSLSATTDEEGQFRITGVVPGAVEIRARRLGFVPTVQHTRIAPYEMVHRVALRMAPLPTTLRPVLVRADRVEYSGRLAGYYERLHRRHIGQFISREEIDRKQHRSLSRLLAQLPGVNALQLRSGGGVVRMRGQRCRPLVWIDGVPMPAGEVDLDAFPVNTLHGIEVYLGGTTAPLAYTSPQNRSSCGTILLWSRGPDTDPPRGLARRGVDLEALVSSLSIYTSDQVDKPAALDARQPLQAIYPTELFASGINGSVVAEFVVDAQGRIEPGTFAIVSSTHPLFSAAAARALQSAIYVPATKDGKVVRQVVQQPVRFASGSARAQSQ
jgi:TonB family protein